MYVVIEGIDGSGKSTQTKILKNNYNNIVVTREPGGTGFGNIIRDITKYNSDLSEDARYFLFLAGRAELYDKVISKHKNDKVLVSDRSFLSGLAYRFANDIIDTDILIGTKKHYDMQRFALKGCFPDKVVILTISEDVVKKRLNERSNKDVIESKGVSFLMEAQSQLIKTADNLGLDYIAIDGTMPIVKIHARITEYLEL